MSRISRNIPEYELLAAPVFTSYTSVLRQAVRLDSTSFDSAGNRKKLTPSWTLPFASSPGLDPLDALVAPPYSRRASISSGSPPQLLGLDRNVGEGCVQQPTGPNSAGSGDALVGHAALIAELREEVVQDFMSILASAGTQWQSALERTLHGRSRSLSMSDRDVEAGLRHDS